MGDQGAGWIKWGRATKILIFMEKKVGNSEIDKPIRYQKKRWSG
jgi:hypothetical protein